MGLNYSAVGLFIRFRALGHKHSLIPVRTFMTFVCRICYQWSCFLYLYKLVSFSGVVAIKSIVSAFSILGEIISGFRPISVLPLSYIPNLEFGG